LYISDHLLELNIENSELLKENLFLEIWQLTNPNNTSILAILKNKFTKEKRTQE
jgi:hypothetical protein